MDWFGKKKRRNSASRRAQHITRRSGGDLKNRKTLSIENEDFENACLMLQLIDFFNFTQFLQCLICTYIRTSYNTRFNINQESQSFSKPQHRRQTEQSNECESMLWNFTYGAMLYCSGACSMLMLVHRECKEWRQRKRIQIQTQEMICLCSKHLFAFIVNFTILASSFVWFLQTITALASNTKKWRVQQATTIALRVQQLHLTRLFNTFSCLFMLSWELKLT